MLYDCFLFLDELDLLDIRLHELSDVVDKFVISESSVTFAGEKKEYIFGKNKKRFGEFLDKIIYHTSCNFSGQPWDREIAQRNSILAGTDLKDNDIIMISDIDEIPRAEIIAQLECGDFVNELHLDWYHYRFNLKLAKAWCPGVKLTTHKHLQKNYGSLHDLRSANKSEHRYYENAGWHFSYCCDIKSKIEAYSHQENNTEKIKNNISKYIENEEVFWDKAIKINKVEIDNSFPEYLKNNQDKFRGLIK